MVEVVDVRNELEGTELEWTELEWTELEWTELEWTELEWTELAGLPSRCAPGITFREGGRDASGKFREGARDAMGNDSVQAARGAKAVRLTANSGVGVRTLLLFDSMTSMEAEASSAVTATVKVVGSWEA